jgi:hypothetical protein
MKARDLAVLAVLGGLAYFFLAKKPETVEANVQQDVMKKQAEELQDLANQVQEAIARGDYATAYDLLLKQEQLKAQVITPVVVPQQEQVTIQKVELTPEEKQEIINYVQSVDLPAEEKQTLIQEMLKQAEMLKNASLGVGLRIYQINIWVEKIPFVEFPEAWTVSVNLNGYSASKYPVRNTDFVQFAIGGSDLKKLSIPGTLTLTISTDIPFDKQLYYRVEYYAKVEPVEYSRGIAAPLDEKSEVVAEGMFNKSVTRTVTFPYPATMY